MSKITHPEYDFNFPNWELMEDAYQGEGHVKSKGSKYLKPTPGMVLDGITNTTDPGYVAYAAYLDRAVFPDFVQVGVETLVGILNAKPPEVKLPAELEYVLQNCSADGEGLLAVLRRLHAEQLTTGRVGLHVDLPVSPDPANPQPYIAIYAAKSIINWDESADSEDKNKLQLVVLDESGNVREGMRWTYKEKYRTLFLTPEGVYAFTVGESSEDAPLTGSAPMIRGKVLTDIPFVFLNSKDLLAKPDMPPLLGLGRLCFTVYRSEADYRQALFMQSQDTLVVVGGIRGKSGLVDSSSADAVRVGAGARIDVEIGGDAKYIGVNSQGLSEQRQAIENDRQHAAVRTGQLLAPGKMSLESGEALKTRIAAQTATLTQIAITSVAALEKALKHMAKWMGVNENEVSLKPNIDFTNIAIQGQDLVQLITAKNLGYPMSYETLFMIAKERGLTRNNFEEELTLIEKDPKSLVERAAMLSGALTGNNPTQVAGGPKSSTEGQKQQTNVPKN